MPPLAAMISFLSFSNTAVLFVVGAVVWGIAMGAHESTMRAAVADLVPAHRRGAGFGMYTAVYGLAWLGGTTVIGWLYGRSTGQAAAFIVAEQVVAFVLLLFALGARRPRS
jgi:MFS family permease